ncbi:unnamed protein product [Kluyveromyces dobzhanskii CBS 2104]|uniref:WGS project CCBQ000000000 data, contig 00008 n=1 Tax=Kluyveromyces dobzhanskii CBS 2104 TaxID=1427455 RepID=A0A0A8L9I4_9SACH|nr:unnamed protein product [Kluyveromyces dobzhanskii CBS 2104]
MDKPIEETIKALLSFVVRQFYPNSYVLVLDAIMFHSVLSEEDLAHLLGIKRPELRSLITVLLEDRILTRHSQQEFAVNSRSVKRYYYYIKYPQAIDAIKWKVHQIVAKLKDDLDKNSTPQGYICPLCSTRFTQLEAIALLNYERTQFICSLCEEPLIEDDSGKRSKEKQGRLNRLMDQVQPIIDYLKKIDDNMIEENTFETALARLIPPQNNSVAQYTLNPRARKSRMFVPGDIAMGNESSRKAGVKSQATLHVNITTQYDELYQQDQQEKQAEEKRKQNALPAWHEKSTIGETELGNLRDEYDMSSGVKIEEEREMEEEDQGMDNNVENYDEIDFDQQDQSQQNGQQDGQQQQQQYQQPIMRSSLTDEQMKEREAERTLAEYYAQLARKNADEDDDDMDEDDDEDDFEDVQDDIDDDADDMENESSEEPTKPNDEEKTESTTSPNRTETSAKKHSNYEDDDDDMADLEDIELESVKADENKDSKTQAANTKKQINGGKDDNDDGEDGFEDV